MADRPEPLRKIIVATDRTLFSFKLTMSQKLSLMTSEMFDEILRDYIGIIFIDYNTELQTKRQLVKYLMTALNTDFRRVRYQYFPMSIIGNTYVKTWTVRKGSNEYDYYLAKQREGKCRVIERLHWKEAKIDMLKLRFDKTAKFLEEEIS